MFEAQKVKLILDTGHILEFLIYHHLLFLSLSLCQLRGRLL